MEIEIVMALIPLIGSIIGTVGGIVISSTRTNYRLQELEKKQDKHNSIIERMFIAEGKINSLEREVRK